MKVSCVVSETLVSTCSTYGMKLKYPKGDHVVTDKDRHFYFCLTDTNFYLRCWGF